MLQGKKQTSTLLTEDNMIQDNVMMQAVLPIHNHTHTTSLGSPAGIPVKLFDHPYTQVTEVYPLTTY